MHVQRFLSLTTTTTTCVCRGRFRPNCVRETSFCEPSSSARSSAVFLDRSGQLSDRSISVSDEAEAACSLRGAARARSGIRVERQMARGQLAPRIATEDSALSQLFHAAGAALRSFPTSLRFPDSKIAWAAGAWPPMRESPWSEF